MANSKNNICSLIDKELIHNSVIEAKKIILDETLTVGDLCVLSSNNIHKLRHFTDCVSSYLDFDDSENEETKRMPNIKNISM